jgi:UDP-N-acetylmuramate--L-alanine ligase
MNWDQIKKIHFVGIGGAGMSAVAGLASNRGFKVSGSDSTEIYNPTKSVLDQYGIDYQIGYDEGNIVSAAPDLVVATAAVDESNPEITKALELNIPIISFPEVLGHLTNDKKRIVVVGTHGKGTTSGMIAYALKELTDSSFFVGGVLSNLNTNFYFGKGEYFVLEGDEYKSANNNLRPKFSYYNPDLLLINNIEFDHPDLYPDLESFKKPFRELVASMGEDKLIVYNADDKNVLEVIEHGKARKIGFTFKAYQSGSEYSASYHQSSEISEIEVDLKQKRHAHVQTFLPGMIYAYNTLAALSVLSELGLSVEQTAPFLEQYKGLKRRFELVTDKPFPIIDDYAHHPTAVKSTLETMRAKYPDKRIVCFFEPHTYSRTKQTLPELEHAFDSADVVYISEVYPAREQKFPESIKGVEVVSAVSKHRLDVHFVENKGDALAKYKAAFQQNDVVVVMAVGSFNTLAYDLKQLFEQEAV